ncbi:MAG: hypothetical protein ACYTEP_03405 [Planctomycetota bacterium]|jgi:hypothetical protein
MSTLLPRLVFVAMAPCLFADAVGAQQSGPLPQEADSTLNLSGGSSSGGSGVVAGSSSSGFDDFNRANGPLGPDWGVGSGSYEILNNQFANVGSANGWALYNGATSLYDQAVIEFDLEPNPSTLAYTAAIIGAGGTEMTFTKIQGSPTYTNVGFYVGVNGGGVSGYGGFFTITAVTGGRVQVYVTNGGDTMNADIDEDFDGVYEYHYEASGLIASGIAGQLGDQVGLSAYSTASRADNFSVNGAGPEPVLALLDVIPGQFMTFDVSNMDVGSSAVIVLSSLGPGPTITPFGEIEVTQPWRQTPPFLADSQGILNFTSTLPPGASGQTFFMQAVEMKEDASTQLTNSLAIPIP